MHSMYNQLEQVAAVLQQALHLVHELQVGVVLCGRLVGLGRGVGAAITDLVDARMLFASRRSSLIVALHAQSGRHKSCDIGAQIPAKHTTVRT